MKTLTIKNLSVTDYEGKYEPLVFVHAFPLSSAMWDEQVKFFKDKYRVVTYDVRGLGKSHTGNNEIHTMESYADDLIFIIKEMKLEKINACGLSMGGYILLHAYHKEPELFSKLILADTKAAADDNEGLKGRAAMLNKLQTQGKDFLLNDFLPKLISEEGHSNDGLVKRIKQIISSNESSGIAKAVAAIAMRLNHTENLDTINVPALIIIGEHDKLTPIENSQKMQSAIKNSKLEIIEGAGHISNMENPQDFNKALAEFLDAK
jgi:pimeloyl-ACP methyl ester carboxylesterase